MIAENVGFVIRPKPSKVFKYKVSPYLLTVCAFAFLDSFLDLPIQVTGILYVCGFMLASAALFALTEPFFSKIEAKQNILSQSNSLGALTRLNMHRLLQNVADNNTAKLELAEANGARITLNTRLYADEDMETLVRYVERFHCQRQIPGYSPGICSENQLY